MTGNGPAAGKAPPGAPLDVRARDLARLADERWDLVIVGGGIVGGGALLDAASRGMKAALVERDDIAVGTSSRSSRLIHGGLRYLEQLRVGLVREALHERARLLELAPHLVSLETFLFPLHGRPVVTRGFYAAGMALYDLLGSARSGGRHRHLGVAATLDYAPALRRDRLRGGIVYHDAMEDDARYALAVVRTAQALGTVAVTRAEAVGPLREGDRVTGVRVEDRLSGTAFDVRADAVLDATGVWGAETQRPLPGASFTVLPSRGIHLLVPRDRIPARGGMTIRIPGRTAFLVPWPRHWVVGTTDAPYRGSVDRPSASGGEVDQVLATLNGAFDLGLSRDDVVGTYAGLRPLVAPADAASTVKLSREHRVSVEAPGLVRVSGGKYTTYRVMARDAVDAVLGSAAGARSSGTHGLPLVGAAPRPELGRLAARLAADEAVGEEAAASLVSRHGTEAEAVVALGRERGLLARLVAGFPFLEAEVAWAVERESALSLDDVLARRMRLAPELRDRGASIAPRVADLVGTLLGWDAARRGSEVSSYLEGARLEYDVPPEK